MCSSRVALRAPEPPLAATKRSRARKAIRPIDRSTVHPSVRFTHTHARLANGASDRWHRRNRSWTPSWKTNSTKCGGSLVVRCEAKLQWLIQCGAIWGLQQLHRWAAARQQHCAMYVPSCGRTICHWPAAQRCTAQQEHISTG